VNAGEKFVFDDDFHGYFRSNFSMRAFKSSFSFFNSLTGIDDGGEDSSIPKGRIPIFGMEHGFRDRLFDVLRGEPGIIVGAVQAGLFVVPVFHRMQLDDAFQSEGNGRMRSLACSSDTDDKFPFASKVAAPAP